MSNQIAAEKAKEYIKYYREGLPEGSLKSAWLSRDVIDAIVELNATRQLDGLRVYLAKYSEDDPNGRFSKDVVTIITVPTENSLAKEGIDIQTAYYDYSRLCPPYCNADEGD